MGYIVKFFETILTTFLYNLKNTFLLFSAVLPNTEQA